MIFLYFFLILLIGLYNTKTNKSIDYLFASRKITLTSFIATIVTTWYGGILEIGRFTYFNGIITFIIFGLFYYISAIIFTLYIGPKIHKNNIKSIPEYFNNNFGLLSGIISSILIILITSPAPYILIMSIILKHIINIDTSLSIFLSIALSTIYIYNGGYKAIIRTDKLQFVLMYLGFFILLLFLYNNYGGYNYLINNVPKENLSLRGHLSLSYIISWIFIAFIIIIDPCIFQRTFSCKNNSIIKKGLIISIFCWIVFDLMTVTSGLYASAIIPKSELYGNPYLQLISIVLPPFWEKVFLLSLLAIIMSTIDSLSFVSAITIGNTLNKFNNNIKDIKIGLLITAIISFILCYSFEYALDIWYVFGSIAASSLIIPFTYMLYNKKYCVKYPTLTLLIPTILTSTGFIISYPFNIDPIYIGLITSLILNYIFSIKSSLG